MEKVVLKEADFETIFGFKPEPRSEERLAKVIAKLKIHASSYESLNRAWGKHSNPNILEGICLAVKKEIDDFDRERAVATFFGYHHLPETIDECVANI